MSTLYITSVALKSYDLTRDPPEPAHFAQSRSSRSRWSNLLRAGLHSRQKWAVPAPKEIQLNKISKREIKLALHRYVKALLTPMQNHRASNGHSCSSIWSHVSAERSWSRYTLPGTGAEAWNIPPEPAGHCTRSQNRDCSSTSTILVYRGGAWGKHLKLEWYGVPSYLKPTAERTQGGI